MGNKMEKVHDDDDGSVTTSNATFDIKKIYWDSNGNLRHGTTHRNRDEEVVQMLQTDSNDENDYTKLWMIVPSRWIRKWLLFSHLKLGDPPGPIDMWSLLKQDTTVSGGWRPKKTLLPPSTVFGEERPGHYRRVTLEAWINLVELYGVEGLAIAVRGTPYDDLERWRVFKDPKMIDINLLPEPVAPTVDEIKEESLLTKGIKDSLNTVGGVLGGIFGSAPKDDKQKAASPV